jgi:hypothetical protein
MIAGLVAYIGFFKALDARCRKMASNEPEGVATLPRHFFLSALSPPPPNKYMRNKLGMLRQQLLSVMQ